MSGIVILLMLAFCLLGLSLLFDNLLYHQKDRHSSIDRG